MNPLKILEKQCIVIGTMKLIIHHPGKTTAELEKLTDLPIATFYRHMANLRRLGLVEYRQDENKVGRPIVHYPKYRIRVEKI